MDHLIDENSCLIPTCGGRDHGRIRGTYYCFPKSVSCLNTYTTGKDPLTLHQRSYGGYYAGLKLVKMQRIGEHGKPGPSWYIYNVTSTPKAQAASWKRNEKTIKVRRPEC